MKSFLNDKMVQQMDLTTMEYIFNTQGMDEFNGWYSTSLKFHSEILLNKAMNGEIPDNYEIVKYLTEFFEIPAIDIMTEYSDFVVQLTTKTIEFDKISILHFSENLSDFQLYRLRLWWEFFELKKIRYTIRYFGDGEHQNFENENSKNQLLLRKKMFDDNKIDVLSNQYKNFDSHIRRG